MQPYYNPDIENIDIFQDLYVFGSTGTGKTQWVKSRVTDFLMEEVRKSIYENEFYDPNEKERLCYEVVYDFESYYWQCRIFDRFTTKKGTGMMFITADKINIEYQTNKFEFDSLYKKLAGCRLAVIDDLGTKKSSDYSVDIVREIINERVERNLPTIVTSNKKLHEIAELIDDRLADRLSTFRPITSFDIKGDDMSFRSEKAKLFN
jgi:Cdc6-like AAA superfamily ATPase